MILELVAGDLPGIDSVTLANALNTLIVVLLVYVVRHVTHEKVASDGDRQTLEAIEMKLSVLASNVAWTDNPRNLRESADPPAR